MTRTRALPGERPIPRQGVVILIVVLVCLVVLGFKGFDLATVTGAIIAAVAAAAQFVRPSRQRSDGDGRQAV
jgi:hypothetical protein